MKYTRLGNTDYTVSRLGFGGARWAGGAFPPNIAEMRGGIK